MKQSFKNSLIVVLTLMSLIISALGVTPAQAATFTVMNTNDSGLGSLRQAITDAVSGDTITFDPQLFGETITLTSELILDKNLTIDGSSLASQVIISGNNSVRVFYINEGVTVIMDSLTISQGYAPDGQVGSGINNWGELTVLNSTLSDNASGNGSAIGNNGVLTVTNSTLSNNTASSEGTIRNLGTATIANSTIFGNSAFNGGAIANYGGATLTLINSTLSNNSATGIGGNIINSGMLNYSNTIIANATVGEDCISLKGGTIGTNVNNLVEDGGCSASLSGDPNLDTTLAGNGTLALLSGSSAIDAGDDGVCAAAPISGFDQRSVTRPQGVHCDIGAYEYESAAPATHTVTFDGNGADGGAMSNQVASSPTALTANAFTRTSYTFSGWNTASDGSGTAYTDGASYDFAADITLYAQWSLTPPTVTTLAATNVTATSATLYGTVNANGNDTTAKFYYHMNSQLPVCVENLPSFAATPATVSGSTDTDVSYEMTGLTPETTYYFCAYGLSTGGADMGDLMSFTTASIPLSAPTVTTQDTDSIQQTTANAHFTITDLGNPHPDSYGVVYSDTNTVPDIATDTVNDLGLTNGTANSTDPMSASLSGLTPGTMYYLRGFATNSEGTAYGSVVTFTTKPGAFDAVAPLNNATSVSTSPTLSWSASQNADDYQYCYAPATENPLHCMNETDPGWISTSGALSATLSGLQPNTQYVWGARASAGSSYTYFTNAPFFFTTAASTPSSQRALNGGFNTYVGASKNPKFWVSHNFAGTDGKSLTVHSEGTASVRMNGTVGKTKTLTQTLNLSGSAGDQFTFSFKEKGNAIPADGLCRGQVRLYNGATLVNAKTINCTPGTHAFQAHTLTFNASGSYTQVVIRFVYKNTSGTVWFDAVRLMK